MRLSIVFAVTVLTYFAPAMSGATQTPIARTGFSVAVTSQSEGQMASTELSVNKPKSLGFNIGPNCGIYVAQLSRRWMDSKQPPRAPSGELVSGFRFAGWMEGRKAKVIVWALLNDKGAEYAATDEKKLQGQLIETYLIEPGEKLRLKDMERYGVKPVDLVISETRSQQ